MKKLITIAIVLALLSISIAIAGNAYGKNKVKNTSEARECAGVNFDPHADDLGVADDVIQCLQSKGLAVNSAVCAPGPDDCCNVAYADSDVDCATGACAGFDELCNGIPCCEGYTCSEETGKCI